jgi:hypothetical protein
MIYTYINCWSSCAWHEAGHPTPHKYVLVYIYINNLNSVSSWTGSVLIWLISYLWWMLPYMHLAKRIRDLIG